jgi:ADP-dependent NAD(P)H-hydrate dehydratase
LSADLTIIDSPPTPPSRPADGHKGTFGTVMVVGGSPTMMGAPALCAKAAFRSGAGLVKIVTDPSVLPTAIAIEPGVTGILLQDDPASSLTAIDLVDPDHQAVLAIGPGLGQSDTAVQLVSMLLQSKRKTVLDADGLNVLPAVIEQTDLSGDKSLSQLAGQGLILTPHPGEFSRLAKWLGIKESPTDPEMRPAAAAALARKFGDHGQAVVVLKGKQTVVTDGRQAYINQTGNPALATAGSGDVLTGCIAALLAAGMNLFDAASLGVYLHGYAADLWAQEFGPSGLSAMDLASLLPDAFQMARQDAEQPSDQESS